MNTSSTGRLIGLLMILSASVFWGIAGTMIQWLIERDYVRVEGLVALRLIPAGLMILLFLRIRKQNVWAVWKDWQARIPLVLYGIAGILGLQYSFMNTIKYDSAINATLFQFTGPILIALYIALKFKKLPVFAEWLSMIAAFLGIFLVITGGSVHRLSLHTEGLFWGALTALTFAFYTVYPIKLLQKWGAALISGWGMLIGGVFFAFVRMPFHQEGMIVHQLDAFSIFLLIFIVIFGTGFAFMLYLGSLRYLKPVVTSILSSIEPFTTVVFSVLWLAESFTFLQGIGGAFIVGSAMLLSIKKAPSSRSQKKEALERTLHPNSITEKQASNKDCGAYG